MMVFFSLFILEIHLEVLEIEIKNMRQKKIYRKTGLAKKNKILRSRTKKRRQSMCAPFIQPLDLSPDTGLTQANINIIKSATDETCFSIDALRKIATKWNTTYPERAINFTDSTSGKSLWNSINNAMRAECTNEVCWLKHDFIKETPLAHELMKNFRPMMPKKWESNPREWLNTIDIRNVMNQYEVKHPDFEFIGPVPMDFDSNMGFGQCVINELCNIKLESQFEKGKRRIGVIFNLDKHTQPGSHWVAMYAQFSPENKNGEIAYWDSYGMKPNPEVVALMNRLKAQATELGHQVVMKSNKRRHQYKNTECGVYCIYFLTSFLEGRAFENIVENIITDDKMFEKRKDFFANSN
jgi:hypothetical protein